ncbi:MAG TPA: histone deacetylase [Burkholderiales bacterium]|nr:histone deacetylase [Burkholderiales bacterium]
MKAPHSPSRRDFLQASAAWMLAASAPALAQAGAKTRVFHHPVCLKHLAGRQHPERPARLEAVLQALGAAQFRERIVISESRPAREEDILMVHTREYLDKVRQEVAAGRTRLSTGDTELSADSLAAALAAAGAVLAAVDAVMAGEARNAFCAVRPPGHHASAGRGMGFCIFNSIAIGTRHALRRHGLNRVLIADWDVHHGNGTQDIFYSDGKVLFFDTHEDPWYPGTGSIGETGEGKAKGLIINRPFPPGAGRREILGAFREVLVPAAERFRPELVMVSCGFDSRIGDPLGQFTLTDPDYALLTEVVMEIAARHAGGRLVSVLEGGYALEGLASAASAHVGRLAAAAG